MNSNPTRTLFLSIGAGVLAMLLVYSYSQEKKAEYDKLYGTTKRVVVASKQILEMSTIDDTMIEFAEVPVNFIQPGAIENPEEVIGTVAASPIQQGEQILGTKLLAPGPSTGLSNQVAPGKRAVTLSIDEVRGVAKLVRPGDRIDILATIESGTAINRKTEVKTIMQDVVVLATGINVTNNIPRSLESDSFGNNPVFRNLNGDTSFNSITIEASPKEAQDLVYLQVTSPGGIFITLRNSVDRAKNTLSSSAVNTVLGRASEPEVSRAVEQRLPTAIPTPAPVKRAPVRSAPKRTGPFVEVK
ncbi:MAG: Flp pilus assembly protein CpaB [Bdellovibrionales bacterium]|nr:Flp pilus assembly protein CpaB [Bdellovibrionales bacterium]